MPRSEVVDLTERDELGEGRQHGTCANPRCDEQFFRTPGPGRRKDFHSEDCRRSAERDLRRTLAQLRHHEIQAEQLRARAQSYTRTHVETLDVEESETDLGPTADQRRAARDAVLEVRGMARFLENHQGDFAADLLKLYRAVEPVVG